VAGRRASKAGAQASERRCQIFGGAEAARQCSKRVSCVPRLEASRGNRRIRCRVVLVIASVITNEWGVSNTETKEHRRQGWDRERGSKKSAARRGQLCLVQIEPWPSRLPHASQPIDLWQVTP
jgi:hypothetical protein